MATSRRCSVQRPPAWATGPSKEEFLEEAERRVRAKLRVAPLRSGDGDIRSLFGKYDRDHSGLLSFEEIRLAVRKDLRIPPAAITDDELRAVFNKLDNDGSGHLDVDELLVFMSAAPRANGSLSPETEQKKMARIQRNLRVARNRMHPPCKNWKVFFEKLDVDDDSALSLHELMRAMRQELKLGPWDLSQDDVKLLFQEMDADGNDKISVSEFIAFLEECDALGSVSTSHLETRSQRENVWKPHSSLSESDLRPKTHHLRHRPHPQLAGVPRKTRSAPRLPGLARPGKDAPTLTSSFLGPGRFDPPVSRLSSTLYGTWSKQHLYRRALW
eukprot:gnl/MRDRNA2_/MRDRNA2_111805_c0_seq1.p1 gnl/MRDRNA2_/MRDRNA2_111805_c0~~gnl/MRDRNA2_/MRDRNA2_111805_c0_seq1.p1  ORF type:complete len:346 (-),score=72.16 gnl/MRDRNA2_/MRDRNA2_111805_c0_seq1:6-992(-)